LLESEKLLQAEKESSMLREQFIAILGHDLRNPVNAISNSAQFMLRFPLEEPMKKMATVIKNSSFRIISLINNMLDFARVRMGGGVEVNKIENDNIGNLLTNVISEITAIYPDRIIQQEFELQHPVNCDEDSLAQLLSNLVGNAIQHGRPDTPIRVIAKCRDNQFILSVCNEGESIPPEKMDQLFLPFFRGGSTPGKQGLGLGLYIASGIAKAHGGRLSATSDEKETCFTLILPQ
jgi:signal transduction histidine kinase